MNARSGLVAVLLTACGVPGPVPLAWEAEACSHCHMTLADRRYGAEIITTKGRALPFDDAGCAAEHLATRELGLDEVSSVWVIDYLHPDSLISATTARFVRSEGFKTPMGSGIVATADAARADSLARAIGGEVLSWTEVLTLAERDFLGAH
jgi:copper chaperone NosL